MNLTNLYVIPEWERESNYKEFEYKGYSCAIRRNMSMGFLCGYFAIPDFVEGEESYLLEDLSPHGGISFAEYPDGHYLPKQNSFGQKLYWVGFDCGHYCDFAPGLAKVFQINDAIYRNMAYVEQEIKDMVDQFIKAIENNEGG